MVQYDNTTKRIEVNLNQFNTFSWINVADEIVLTINMESQNFTSEFFVENLNYPKIKLLNLINGHEIKLVKKFPNNLIVNAIRVASISSNIEFDGIVPNFEISNIKKNIIIDLKATEFLKSFGINASKGIRIVNLPKKIDDISISSFKYEPDIFENIKDLRYLKLSFTQGLFDLELIKSYPSLESFRGYWARATNVWPNSQELTELRFVSFDSLSGLSDIKGLAKAPNLKYLLAISRHIKGADFEIFKEHPALEIISLWPKSHKEELLFEKWFGKKFIKSGFESFEYNSDKRELNLS